MHECFFGVHLKNTLIHIGIGTHRYLWVPIEEEELADEVVRVIVYLSTECGHLFYKLRVSI